MRALVKSLFADPIDLAPVDGVLGWWSRHAVVTRAAEGSIARAALGGLAADRLGYAFASGYLAALQKLVPVLAGTRAALCATETGGAHPRAIESALTPCEGGYTLRGHKRWVTLADLAEVLLVVASMGKEGDRNRLRVARVLASAPGVTLSAAAPVPFCPEIGHAEVRFEDVYVPVADVLEGDGYEAFLKPFRTIEDLHVLGSALGYAVGCVRRCGLDRGIAARAVALLIVVEALSNQPPLAPEVHVALAGAFAEGARVFDDLGAALAASPAAQEEAARWSRDRPLLGVAGSARSQRTARAFEQLMG